MVNGKPVQVAAGTRVSALQVAYSADVVIRNGYQTSADFVLRAGEELTLIRKGELPPREALSHMMAARHSPRVHEAVAGACVGVAGLGGLGSHIAVLLARTGVGRLILADYDVVDPSNLNRQHYGIRHLGMPKTDALAEQLADINPFITVETHTIRVAADNAAALFGECQVVCEAFDDPACKAELVGALLAQDPGPALVAASGMAGYGSANAITTRRRMKRLYVCGDGETEAQEGCGLMAPRVAVCAAHQANMALRLLLGLEEA